VPLTSATPLHQEMALGAVLPRLPFSASFPRLLSWPVPGMKPSLLKLDCAAASRLNSNGHEVLVLNTHAAKLNAVRAKTQYAANEQPQRINNSPANVTGAMAAAAWYYKTLKNRPRGPPLITLRR
jgi:hypothetical protein